MPWNEGASFVTGQSSKLGAWIPTETYSQGDGVWHDGHIYESLTDNNLNNPPSASSSYWRQMDQKVSIHDFDVGDWVLQSNEYYLELTHGFETNDVVTNFRDASTCEVSLRYKPETTNKIRAYVPSDPDLRFEGRAFIVERV